MSAALNTRADSSYQSTNNTHPDLSLPSFHSNLSTPARRDHKRDKSHSRDPTIRIPSTTSATTAPSSAPVSTPSPPTHGQSSFSRKPGGDDGGGGIGGQVFSRRHGSSALRDTEEGEEGGGVLDTPDKEKDKKWGGEGPETPMPARMKRARSSGAKGVTNLTLRDQEKHIDSLKKDNFSLQLKVHFLEERLAQLAPDQMETALKQNINLKIEVQQHRMELKKLKKLILELEKELERSQRSCNHDHGRGRERELEEKLEERERELRDLRRRFGGVGSAAVSDEVVRELEMRNVELEEELEGARGLLEDNQEELDRLRDIVESGSSNGARGGQDRERIEELEAINDELRNTLEDQAALLSQPQILAVSQDRDAAEEDINTLRDKVAALTIELAQKEEELEVKEEECEMRGRELDEMVAEHERVVEVVEMEWRGEAEEARQQVEELRDNIQERDAESKELRLNIAELESTISDLHQKFEQTLAHLEQETLEKDIEIEEANREIERMGEVVYRLEDELDRMKAEAERAGEDWGVEKETLEATCAALKDARQEELARHIEDVVSELQREREAHERLSSDFDDADRRHASELRSVRRDVEAKESALQKALNDLTRTQALLTQREDDLGKVQAALQGVEQETRKLGDEHTTARFSLQLEVDRLKRDLERLEDELSRARKELDERDGRNRDRDNLLDKLHAENRELSSQLAAQTQARLNVSEKLDTAQAQLKAAESELGLFRSRVSDLEARLSKDQRSLLVAEGQYRDQLTERNTLLLTIYQYMDKILGVDKTPKKAGQAETKPFTNFSVFHDNLITRLKQLSQIQLDFDRRVKEAETKFMEKLTDMRKQLDQRWKQIDKFEVSVKNYGDTKSTWRRQLSVKEGELEALKATNTELTATLSRLRRPLPGESTEVKSLQARAVNAERRFINSQNQLAAAEEKLAAANQKTTVVDNKWEARVKEYEARLKAAEEKVKREKQGNKERITELENQVESLKRQKELETRRKKQLEEIIDANKVSSSPTR
ncbi:hypothetical protein JAAARDRAFT_127047 [Jaapia argillacea MUCL 33604]|uniref:Centrosomin N-terminal motif 1 domain-containing protein n=1 Tax=Jaapia argillacea MUCL 33604 TaxID=933084 RepID=A0A067QBI4_9AGAM|nr:hypothetical protein JAAARDRAFT_127047 [Jaapia argillacea MUCL 33604]